MVRILLLAIGLVVLAQLTALGFGGRNDVLLGPAASGSQVPYHAQAQYNGRDTGNTFVTAYITKGVLYNSDDKNEMAALQLHRSWATRYLNLSLGGHGIQGSYRYSNGLASDNVRLKYKTAGFTAEAQLALRYEDIDFLIGLRHGHTWEWGQTAALLQQKSIAYDSANFSGTLLYSNELHHQATIFHIGANLKPGTHTRFGYSFGIGGSNRETVYQATAHAGYKGFTAHLTTTSCGRKSDENDCKRGQHTIGLSYAIPSIRKLVRKPD